MKTIRIALGLPWYAGPDKDCWPQFMAFAAYLGRLQERLDWLAKDHANTDLKPLDPFNVTGQAEVPEWLIGTRLEFVICGMVGYSLPGAAREACVDLAIQYACDYILFFDADMIFDHDTFLRLLADDKDIVGALAFTSRTPIEPVIYGCREVWSEQPDGSKRVDLTFEKKPDYLRDTLYEVDAIGGGVMLIKMSVFADVPKPWFTSTGMGEDIFFCMMARRHGKTVWVDTRVKTAHKPRAHARWHDEELYLEQRAHSGNPHVQQLQDADRHLELVGA